MVVELGCNDTREESLLMPSTQWSKGLYKCVHTSFISTLCITWLYPCFVWSEKSAFFILCLEPCVNTELQSSVFWKITVRQILTLLIRYKHTLLLLLRPALWPDELSKLLAGCTCLPVLVLYWSAENIWWLWNTWAGSLWVSFRGIHFLLVSFTVVRTK